MLLGGAAWPDAPATEPSRLKLGRHPVRCRSRASFFFVTALFNHAAGEPQREFLQFRLPLTVDVGPRLV